MKIKNIAIAALIVLSFESCDKDNYDAPDVVLSGRFLDAQNGELVGTSGNATPGARIRLFDVNYTQPMLLVPFSDGNYKTKIFKGNYKIMVEGPFKMVDDTIRVNVDKDTPVDFKVIPNVRLKVTLVEVTETTAKVSVDYERLALTQNLNQIGIIWSTYPYPNSTTAAPTGFKSTFTPVATSVTGTREFTLTGLTPKTRYYLRANGLTANTGAYHNYSSQLIIETK